MRHLPPVCMALCAFIDAYAATRSDATAASVPPTLNEIRTFTHSIPDQRIGFGARGVITEDYVGILRNIGNGPPTLLGALFVHDPTTGELLHQIAPPPQLSNTNYYFGAAFDIHGDLAVVSAQYEHVPTNGGGVAHNAGAAYLYDLSTGQLRHKLVPNQPLFNDFFGGSVAISGNVVAVSSWNYAYLFDATTGQQIARLDGSPDAEPAHFGGPVALNDSMLLVGGVPAGGDISKGAVFVYDLATLDLKRIIQPPDITPYDAFGSRIALDGNHAAISAYQYLFGTGHMGAAYVFDLESGQQLAKIVSTPEVGLPNGLGYAVDILGPHLAVGAPGGNGSALLYDWTAGEPLGRFVHSGVQSEIQFGSAVSLSSRYALVGTAPINVGPNAIYQYALIPEPACGSMFALTTLTVAIRRRRLSRLPANRA